MNIVERAAQENMSEEARETQVEVKVDVESTVEETTSAPEVPHTKEKIEYSNKARYPYQNEVLPPIYMSTIAQPSVFTNYIPTISNSNPKYAVVNTEYAHNGAGYVPVGSDYQRLYQTSPPSIDKAPSFLSRNISKSSDGDNHSNGTAPPSPSTTPPEDKHVWSKGEVELLLDLYETYKDQLKDPRVRKTKVWEDVARIIRERLDSDVNGCQCNQKFRNLKADFQKVLEHNGRPGNFKRVCKYYERLASILNYSGNPNFMHPNSMYQNNAELRESSEYPQRPQNARDIYFENGRSSPSKQGHKRKLHENLQLNGNHNGHAEQYYPIKKSKSNCNCECSQEMANLRETVERVNNYVVARAAHEEERIRRLEDIHREKLIAMSRFVDIFKDFIHKMT